MPTKDATLTANDAPASAPNQVDQMLVMLQTLLERQDRLEREVHAAKAAVPRFTPMQHAGHTAGEAAPRRQETADGYARETDRQLMRTTSGRALNAITLRQYPRRFDVGDRVVVDPASAREGFAEGRTWGDVLAKIRCSGLGVVAAIKGLREATGEWHYLVEVPGLTGVAPDAFGEHELLSA